MKRSLQEQARMLEQILTLPHLSKEHTTSWLVRDWEEYIEWLRGGIAPPHRHLSIDQLIGERQ